MKPGVVVTIRINPANAQSILDILDVAGVPRNSISYAQCVSTALDALLATAKTNGVIPEPDPFQFANRMSEYEQSIRRQNKRTAAVTKLGGLGKTISAPQSEEAHPTAKAGGVYTGFLSRPEVAAPAAPTEIPEPVSYTEDEVTEATRKLTRLLQQKEMAEDEAPGITWSSEDQEDYDRCFRIVYPHG